MSTAGPSVLGRYVRLALGLPEGVSLDDDLAAAVRATLNLDAFMASELVRSREIVQQKAAARERERIQARGGPERDRAAERPRGQGS